jgi:hypothetical protein
LPGNAIDISPENPGRSAARDFANPWRDRCRDSRERCLANSPLRLAIASVSQVCNTTPIIVRPPDGSGQPRALGFNARRGDRSNVLRLQRPSMTANEEPHLQRERSNISKKKPTRLATKHRNDNERSDRPIDNQTRYMSMRSMKVPYF